MGNYTGEQKGIYMKIYALLCLSMLIVGCSNKGIYQDLQRNKRNECLQVPPAEYDRCMRSMEQSYEAYERQRQEALKRENQAKQEQQ